ncbi:hypothetical protein [Adlercreutzia shanghongiae]|uniref:Uncharacterized protein n=1 Tax=Adlercreutzia shanghongiae TaxID=3111773 RepID=A0ABU6IW68_9ACTN|nr:hypothetical protein [Adlercreutzia sp. R22]MEC4294053.1 hypothetical protein [Adlercreutzia sp. R22]
MSQRRHDSLSRAEKIEAIWFHDDAQGDVFIVPIENTKVGRYRLVLTDGKIKWQKNISGETWAELWAK